jgi:hypothetical protein
MNNPPKTNCLAYTQSSKKWSKDWSFGGFRAKLVKRKTDTLLTSEGEEERAEKERGEDPTQRLFPQTKSY